MTICVLCFSLMMSWVGQQSVVVAFLCQTHLLLYLLTCKNLGAKSLEILTFGKSNTYLISDERLFISSNTALFSCSN